MGVAQEELSASPGTVDPVPGAPRRRSRRGIVPYFMILPLLSAIGFLTIYPAVRTLLDSLYYVNPLTHAQGFAGLSNYDTLFHDAIFTSSLVNTWIYVVIGAILLVGAGLGTALTLWHPFRGRSVVIALVVLPWALPGVVEAIIWSWIYDPTFGVLNFSLVKLHFLSQFIVLIGRNRLLTIALTELVQVWQLTPLTCLLILSSLQAVPPDLYEACALDGASKWQTLRRVTLPLIRPGMAIAFVESIISSFTIFDIAYAITGGIGPTATRPVMTGIYVIAFQNENFGEAYAGVFVVSAILIILSAVILRLLYRKVEF